MGDERECLSCFSCGLRAGLCVDEMCKGRGLVVAEGCTEATECWG